LDLAETALESFASADSIGKLGRIGAAAGVAIVHAHAPFFRAYAMAEDLCRSAKRLVVGEEQGFAIDWQIGLGRPGESIDDVRRAQYALPNGLRLTRRPYRAATASAGSWTWLAREVFGGFRAPRWSTRR